MTTVRHEWLALTVEDPIDPDLPICDPHHHFWDRPDDRYLLDDLLRDTSGGHRITETVFVECNSMYREDGSEETRPVGETEFVRDIAAQPPKDINVAKGIVGFADLTLGDAVTPVLEEHMAASDRFRGIRHASAWDASPDYSSQKSPPKGLLAEAAFRKGFDALQKLGLSFDAWLFHPQLPELVDLARAFPDATIILDHIGGPLGIGPYAGRRDEVVQTWRAGVAALADCPNVVIKLGGFGMPIGGYGWHQRERPASSAELAETMGPYYLFCIEKFGVGRCMFESNFPVDKMSVSYAVLWNTFKRIAQSASPTERSSLFRDTAVRAYRL